VALYTYKARDAKGTAVTGTIEAATSEQAGAHLDSLGYLPIFIREYQPSSLASLPELFARSIPPEDIIFFTFQISTALGAGIPLLEGLKIVGQQMKNAQFKAIIEKAGSDIEGGSSLSDSLAKHPRVFPEIYTNMIRAGEASGKLEEIFRRIAEMAEHEAATREKVQSAMRYPKMVVFALVAAFTIVVWFVVPRFVLIFKQFRVPLPLPTRILIGLNDVIQAYWVVLVSLIVALSLFVIWFIRTERGTYIWDSMKIRIPILGSLFLKAALSRFAHILGLLNQSGLPIIDNLQVTAKTIGNVIVARAIDSIRESVNSGSGLAEQMKKITLFTPLVTQMVFIGETTGMLDETLQKVSKYYDMEVENDTKRLALYLESMLTVVLGVMVLLFALAIFMPMWDMTKFART
jgi:type IV pilus assembly protein PilC